jgi:hypothetical protein
LGDYTEDEDLPNYPKASKLYSESKDWTDISNEVAQALKKVFDFVETWPTVAEITNN